MDVISQLHRYFLNNGLKWGNKLKTKRKVDKIRKRRNEILVKKIRYSTVPLPHPACPLFTINYQSKYEILFALNQELLEQLHQTLDALQVIPIYITILGGEDVGEINHLDHGPTLGFLLGAQLVQQERVGLLLVLHLLVVVVLEGVRPFQRVHRLLPGIVVVDDGRHLQVDQLVGRGGGAQDGTLLG